MTSYKVKKKTQQKTKRNFWVKSDHQLKMFVDLQNPFRDRAGRASLSSSCVFKSQVNEAT